MEQPAGADANPYRSATTEVPVAAPTPRPFIPGGRRVSAGETVEWLKEAWRQFASNPLAFYGVLLALFVSSTALGVVPLIGGILAQILNAILAGGIVLGCARRRSGGHFLFADLFSGFQKHFGQLALMGCILGLALLAYVLVVAISVGIGVARLWSGAPDGAQLSDIIASGESLLLILLVALLVLFGILLFMMGYWFAPALIVLYDQPAWSAIKMSFHASVINFWPIFVFGLLLTVVVIVALIPVGLGMFVLAPVMLALPYASTIDVFESPASA